MLVIDHDLAAKHMSPEHVRLGPLIKVCRVDRLVIEQREHALAADFSLEGVRKWGDIQDYRVHRSRKRAGIADIAFILHQHIDLAVGCPAPKALLERQGIFGAARNKRRQVILGGVEPDDAEVVGSELLEGGIAAVTLAVVFARMGGGQCTRERSDGQYGGSTHRSFPEKARLLTCQA